MITPRHTTSIAVLSTSTNQRPKIPRFESIRVCHTRQSVVLHPDSMHDMRCIGAWRIDIICSGSALWSGVKLSSSYSANRLSSGCDLHLRLVEEKKGVTNGDTLPLSLESQPTQDVERSAYLFK